MQEIWKDVIGYEGLYKISSFGRVKSFARNPYGIVLSQSTTKKGYSRCDLSRDKVKVAFPVHRLVAIAFIDNPENLPQVNHIDGDKKNNLVSNLEWNTCQQNIKAAYDTGLKANDAEKHPRSIFSNEQVIEMRKMFSESKSIRQISNLYNSRYDTVWRIIKRINYSTI